MRFIFIFVFFFSALFCSAEESTILNRNYVRKTLDELFEYHIDEKEISEEIVRRALYNYIDSFDSGREYLLSGEVQKYIDPSPSLIKAVIKDYYLDDITVFEEIHCLIEESIQRSRLWRSEIDEDREALFIEAEEYKYKDEGERQFLKDEKEAKSRLRKHMSAFIKLEILRLGHKPSPKEEQLILNFFENKRQDYEHLFLSDDNNFEHIVVVRTLKAYAMSLDSHTAYFSPEEAYEMRVRLEKGLQGVGVVLQEGLDGISIVSLIKDGPAEKSGLIEPKDILVSIDGKSISDLTFHEVLPLIRGENGSKIILVFTRRNENNEISRHMVKLRREHLELSEDRVEYNYDAYGDGVVGVIKLDAFYESQSGSVSSEKDIKAALKELGKHGELKGLILDLRENRGGFLMQGVKVAGLFITNGVVVVSKYSDGQKKYFRDIDGYTYYDGPMVVLTSRASASAAEIVAQSLQDYGVAVVVGDDHTYGKGSIQHQTITNSDGTSALFKVTIGRYYTVSGDSTQIDGVHADVVVEGYYSQSKLGEKFLEYPLASDEIAPAFIDPLEDVYREAKMWYWNYYIPTLQHHETVWQGFMPILIANSGLRIKNSTNYQIYLKALREGKMEESFGSEDLQLNEAKNVLKDMIFMKTNGDLAHMNDDAKEMKK